MKKYLIYTYLFSVLWISTIGAKTAALVVAYRDFQPRECLVTKQLIEKAGITTLMVSDKPGVAQSDGFKVTIKKTVSELTPDDYNGIFFIGGPGALNYLDNNTSYQALKTAAANDKIYGAICISPRILAKAGVLTGKDATGWDGDNKLTSVFKTYGVTYVHKNVVIDGNVITATDPMAAEGFARGIIKLLKE